MEKSNRESLQAFLELCLWGKYNFSNKHCKKCSQDNVFERAKSCNEQSWEAYSPLLSHHAAFRDSSVMYACSGAVRKNIMCKSSDKYFRLRNCWKTSYSTFWAFLKITKNHQTMIYHLASVFSKQSQKLLYYFSNILQFVAVDCSKSNVINLDKANQGNV